ncbi:M13 family metallopeptidase [Dermabacter sp. HSID17554]|uniref:M13 family metallopeptidase n=1 Tax=Dermabacter sp. HSID17554 TaxID=2419511 RepID=UPI000F871E48|nr:M13-type metalloendopeptidase [Dermabacter sp. HSID17554]RUP86024.1 M13 family peptidase [Dermabacter sp. HSID17554]
MTSPTAQTGLDLTQIDECVRPQDDLFGFINGAWLASAEIPADKPSYSEFTRLRDLSEERVRGIIEDAAKTEASTETIEGKIGALYALFMDEQRLNEIGTRDLEPQLERILGLEDRAALTSFTGEATAPTGIIALYVWNDANNPDRYQAQIGQAGLGLPDESFYREEQYQAIREAYVDYLATLADLAQLPGRAGLPDGDARALAETVMDLETRIAKEHVDVVRRRDSEKSNNPMTIDERAEAFPGFDWDAYFEGAGAKAEWVETININEPEYTKAIAKLWGSESLENLRAWLALHAIDAAAPYLSEDFVSAHFDFHGATLSGTTEIRERWKRGVSLVDSALGEAVGEKYVAEYFPPEAKERMEHLVEALITAYRESISSLEWMTPATREKALAKLEKFTPKIGHPEEWKDYSSLDIDPDSLLATVGNIATFTHNFELGKLGRSVDRGEWHMTPQTVNAYYNPGANEIVFPAAILQPPYFGIDADDAVNFGGIGAVIGHEIGHGFDDQGSKYDGDGALKSWWTEADRAEFEKRTRSLIADYDAMSPRNLSDEHHVNGAFTIGENIGDLGGLTIALKAYLNEVGEAAHEVGPDGYTGIQRLFLSWGAVWRGKNREADAIRRLAIDPHAPMEFRANGVVRHIDAFHDAFEVKEGDGLFLAPEHRVSIW